MKPHEGDHDRQRSDEPAEVGNAGATLVATRVTEQAPDSGGSRRRPARKRGDGEGTIYLDTKAGHWRGEVMVGRKADGRRDVRKVSAKTRGECQRRLDAVKRQAAGGLLVEPHRMTMVGLLDRYLDDCATRALRQKTLAYYRQARDRYLAPAVGRIRLTELRPEHIRRLTADLAERGLSPTTVRNSRAVLHAALGFALRQEWIARNVADAVKLPKRRRPTLVTPTPAQMARLVDVAHGAGDRLQALWALAAYSGCRPGELLALHWDDLDLDRGAVTVRRNLTKVPGQPAVIAEPKSNHGRRTLRIGPEAVAALRAHHVRQAEERLRLGRDYDDQGLVFCTHEGGPLLPRNTARSFKRALDRAGLPREIRFYDLRHGNATAMLLAGVSPKAAAERLGHASVGLFHDTYAHMLQELDADAAAKLQSVITMRRRPASG